MQNKTTTAVPRRAAQPAAHPVGTRQARPQQRTARPQGTRPNPAAQRKPSPNIQPTTDWKRLAVCAVCAVLALVGSYFLQRSLTQQRAANQTKTESIVLIDAAKTVRISECMSSNSSTLQDESGAYPDWLEVTNASSSEVNLKGWTIAKELSAASAHRFEFPDCKLKAGETVIVFCSQGQDDATAYHAPFKLSASGDTLILFNPSGTAVQTLNLPQMSSDEAYAEINGTWQVTKEATPRAANTHENYLKAHSVGATVNDVLELSEMMAKNANFVKSENGEYLDWLEIHNTGSYTVNLRGYSLSDNPNKPQMWKFPNVSLGPNEYLYVYCSGYDRVDQDGRIHTSFRLGTEKEQVTLYNPEGQVVETVSYDILKKNQTYAKVNGEWVISQNPTPGSANSR